LLFTRGILWDDPHGGTNKAGTSPCLPTNHLAGLAGPSPHRRHLCGRPCMACLGALFLQHVGDAMTELEQGELRVVVPVGFLLQEEQEVSVSVNRPDGRPLPIRLRLIPARPADPAQISASDPTPVSIGWPTRAVPIAPNSDDGYPSPDFGGGD
jgi:hypothetical protein